MALKVGGTPTVWQVVASVYLAAWPMPYLEFPTMTYTVCLVEAGCIWPIRIMSFVFKNFVFVVLVYTFVYTGQFKGD